MMKPPRILALVMACVLTVASTASAVTLRITDRNLQGLIAQGETSGNKLTLRIDASASGPVMVFIIDGGSVVSYKAVLRNGQIVLEDQPNVSLAKLLSDRGVNLRTETVSTSGGARTHSLPGLTTAPKAPEGASDVVSTPALPKVPGASDLPGVGSGKGNGQGKDDGKDQDKKDKSKDDKKNDEKEKDKGKGKP